MQNSVPSFMELIASERDFNNKEKNKQIITHRGRLAIKISVRRVLGEYGQFNLE